MCARLTPFPTTEMIDSKTDLKQLSEAAATIFTLSPYTSAALKYIKREKKHKQSDSRLENL
jgi:hypothetical protein